MVTEKTKTKTTTTKAKAVKKPVAKKPRVKKVEAIEPAVEKELVEISDKLENDKPGRYFEAVGRRKTSIARVRLFTQGDKKIVVNGKTFEEYFTQPELRNTVIASLDKMKCLDHFGISVLVNGGGINSQAEAVRHGISRALVIFNADFRKRLRRAGYLTRDSRARERKKFGLRRARRAPQWAKR